MIRAGRGVTYFWEDFSNYEEARQRAGQLQRQGFTMKGSRIDCGLCHPEKSKEI